MTNYEIFKKIINFSTITILEEKVGKNLVETVAYIDKYKYDGEKINDYYFIKTLIYLEILEIDSGNWETRERHYKLNNKYIMRTYPDYIFDGINIKKLKNKLMKPYLIESVKELQNIFLKYETHLLRKQKLLKLIK
jgi:hypothetical protein